MFQLHLTRNKVVTLVICAIILGICFNVSSLTAQTTPRMYVDTYPSSGSGDIIDETLRPGENPISGVSLINSHPTAHYSSYGYINTFPNNYASNGSVTNPGYAYDADPDTTYALYNVTLNPPLSGPPGPRPITYFEVAPFNNTGPYTIVSIDFKIKMQTYMYNQSQFRIVYYVGSLYEVLMDWNTATELLNVWEWVNQPEPNDGTWTMADIGNLKIRFEAQKSPVYNASETGGDIRVYDVSARFTVTPMPVGFLNNPANAYDGNLATSASIDISKNLYGGGGYSSFDLKTFNTSIAKPYEVLGITIKIKYTVTPLSNAQHRIVMSVGDAIDELAGWSASPRTSTTNRTFASRAEPNDGVWNWTDISNMRISIQTKKTTAAGYGTANVYDAWVEIPTNRIVMAVSVEDVTDLYSFQFFLNWTGDMLEIMDGCAGPFLQTGGSTSFTFKKYNGATGNKTYVSNTLLGIVQGVSGSGTLAYLEFQVQSYGSTNLQLYETGMADSFLMPITHTTTDGYFKDKLTGDADGDGTVNVFDILKVKYHWYPGPPAGAGGYDRDVDCDDDGSINVFDILIVKANWGDSV